MKKMVEIILNNPVSLLGYFVGGILATVLVSSTFALVSGVVITIFCLIYIFEQSRMKIY